MHKLGLMKHRQFIYRTIDGINGFGSILRLDIDFNGCAEAFRCIREFPQQGLRAEYPELGVVEDSILVGKWVGLLEYWV